MKYRFTIKTTKKLDLTNLDFANTATLFSTVEVEPTGELNEEQLNKLKMELNDTVQAVYDNLAEVELVSVQI